MPVEGQCRSFYVCSLKKRFFKIIKFRINLHNLLLAVSTSMGSKVVFEDLLEPAAAASGCRVLDWTGWSCFCCSSRVGVPGRDRMDFLGDPSLDLDLCLLVGVSDLSRCLREGVPARDPSRDFLPSRG